ncbi:MAG: hypothetical protein EOP53_01515, partial [Sphingobacteriales bacterium]
MEAQTVGVYGGTFYSGWKPYFANREFILGQTGGLILNGILKGQFNPGIEIQFSKNYQISNNQKVITNLYPYFSSDYKAYYSDL